MSFLNKLGIGNGGHTSRGNVDLLPKGRSGGNGHAGAVATGMHREPEMREASRVSNGLKEFLWNLDGLGRGTLLDLGPAWQTTLNFFIERGFRVTSDDLLRDWKEFQAAELGDGKKALTAEEYAERTPEALARKFLAQDLQYATSSFDALLLWDSLDYLEPALVRPLVAHLTAGGSSSSHVSQQEARRVSALSRNGHEYAAGADRRDDFARPEAPAKS